METNENLALSVLDRILQDRLTELVQGRNAFRQTPDEVYEWVMFNKPHILAVLKMAIQERTISPTMLANRKQRQAAYRLARVGVLRDSESLDKTAYGRRTYTLIENLPTTP
jgi:hypothetical protein